jgi:tetratricopeptide (TPR) repeat protein
MCVALRELQVIAMSVLVCVSTVGAPALADPVRSDREKATAILSEGAELYRKADFRRALGNFQAAFALFPSPKIHYNVGLAYQGLRRNAEALKAYERFLAEAQDATPETLADARARAAALETKVGRLVLTCDVDDAEVLLDGALVGRTPMPGPLPVDPGRHELMVRSARLGTRLQKLTAIAGRPVQVRVEMAGGKTAAAFMGANRSGSGAASGAALAEELIAEATQLRRAGQHSRAYPLLRRAYSTQTSARTAAQLGLVELDLGYWLDSEQHLSEGLASARDPWIASHRQDLEASLARVKAAIGELVVSGGAPGSEILVNGRPAGRIPLAAPVRVGEGPVNVEVRPPGRPSEFRSLIMLGGQRQEVSVASAPAAPVGASTAAPIPGANGGDDARDPASGAAGFRRYTRPLAWTAAGLTAGALGFGAYQTVTWHERQDDFNNYRAPAAIVGAKTCGVDDPNRGAPGCAGIYTDYRRARTLAITSFVAAAALGAAATTMFVLSGVDGDSGLDIACAPAPTIRGGTCRLLF